MDATSRDGWATEAIPKIVTLSTWGGNDPTDSDRIESMKKSWCEADVSSLKDSLTSDLKLEVQQCVRSVDSGRLAAAEQSYKEEPPINRSSCTRSLACCKNEKMSCLDDSPGYCWESFTPTTPRLLKHVDSCASPQTSATSISCNTPIEAIPSIHEDDNRRPLQDCFLEHDFCTPSFDDTTISSEIAMISSDKSITSDKATIEELHLQALDQERQVDEVCCRTAFLAVYASSLSTPVDTCTVQPDDCRVLHFQDKIYLTGIMCTTWLLDVAYVTFCSCLTPEWLRSWVWIFQYSSRRSRLCLFVCAPLLAVVCLVHKPLLQRPEVLCFPSNHHYAYAMTHYGSAETYFPEILLEELL